MENYYDDMELLDIVALKGVGVRDTDKGIEIVLMTMQDEILNTYEVNVDLEKYGKENLWKICYDISNRINTAYYNNYGVLNQEIVERIVKANLI